TQSAEEKIKDEVLTQAVTLHLMAFNQIRHADAPDDSYMSDEAEMIKTVNEFSSICRNKPTLKLYDVIDITIEPTDRNAADQANAKTIALLATVPYQTDPSSTRLGKLWALQNQHDKEVEEIANPSPVSETSPTPTEQPVQ